MSSPAQGRHESIPLTRSIGGAPRRVLARPDRDGFLDMLARATSEVRFHFTIVMGIVSEAVVTLVPRL